MIECQTTADQGFVERRAFYGTNALPEPVSKTLLQFMWEALQDKTLIVLIVAAVVEMSIGIYKFMSKNDSLALLDGGAIIVAGKKKEPIQNNQLVLSSKNKFYFLVLVLVVLLVGSSSDFRKQSQFRELNDFSKSLCETKVVRDGETVSVANTDLVVGDICILQTGDVLPADGLLFEGFNVQTDESTLTGEPFSIGKDSNNDPFLLSGTKVVNGVGKMIVVATGVNSLNGRSILALEVEPECTPLQAKLGVVADMIASFGIFCAVSMIVVLLIVYFIVNAGHLTLWTTLDNVLALFILAVTVVVVAVPEGLPLAVTLSLAHATLKMLKDNNLVRHLTACETMGNATTICSDKTGTLTMNKMTVVRGSIMGVDFDDKDIAENLSKQTKPSVFSLICRTLNVNSTADETKDKEGNIVFTGSKTEVALLEMTKKLGFHYKDDRAAAVVTAIEPFSSDRKRMSCVIRQPVDSELEALFGFSDPLEAIEPSQESREWVCVKGASEIILGSCNRYIDSDGHIQPLPQKHRVILESNIENYAADALRTIGFALRPNPRFKKTLSADTISGLSEDAQKISDDSDMIFAGLVGIQDPLREEVPAAVAACQMAGVTVRMVTGDNALTARAIARGCGILTADGLVMEGPKFRTLTQDEMDSVLPKLQVLARSSPLDKQVLVNNLKRLGETVAVTGDGTNDAPALTSADVGFSMGIAGTEVAKEASDIILLDDNFASLVKAVVWGRCVYDSIRKFLQFQLTVNLSAVLITVVTAFVTTVRYPYTMVSVLSPIQLLWINLIMDTMAALALATDPPTPELLQRKPSSRREPIVSQDMAKMVIAQAIYQTAICLVLYFCGPDWFGTKPSEADKIAEIGVDVVTATIIFNTFVFAQVFNEINCRSIDRDVNVFKRFFSNPTFVIILIVTIVAQFIIVQFCGLVFKTDIDGLSWSSWLISVGLGAGSLPVGFLVRIFPEYSLPKWIVPTADSQLQFTKDTLVDEEEDERRLSHSSFPSKTASLAPNESHKDSEPSLRWRDAITKTEMQLRVVHCFQAPLVERNRLRQGMIGRMSYNSNSSRHNRTPSVDSLISGRSSKDSSVRLDIPEGIQRTESPIPARQSPEPVTPSSWDALRDVVRAVSAVNAFRSGRTQRVDYATLQVLDPTHVRQRNMRINARQGNAARAARDNASINSARKQ